MEKQAYFWKGEFILNWKVLRLSLVRREQLLHSSQFSLMAKALTGNEQICFEPLDSLVKMQWLLDKYVCDIQVFFSETNSVLLLFEVLGHSTVTWNTQSLLRRKALF